MILLGGTADNLQVDGDTWLHGGDLGDLTESDLLDLTDITTAVSLDDDVVTFLEAERGDESGKSCSHVRIVK